MLTLTDEYLKNERNIVSENPETYRRLQFLTNYERYKTHAVLSHEALKILSGSQDDRNKNVFESINKDFSFHKTILERLEDLAILCITVKKSKKGKLDLDLNMKFRQEAISNTFDIIKESLQEYKNDSYSSDTIKSLSVYIKNGYIFELLEEIGLNYLNSEKTRYILLEQVLLAPIKLRAYIDRMKINYKNKNHEKIKNEIFKIYMNANTFNTATKEFKKFERSFNKTTNENEAFFKIGKNQIIGYCRAVLYEFFHLQIEDMGKFYYYFHSSSLLKYTTNFGKNQYPYIDCDENYFKEHLPYLQDDFKDIFYDIL
ncbi:MAG: hypothetical protein COA66_02900 [Arcobacter sp.]|nr:MAG: hypothetical protein COA66_02900 [Arcobacter sp.]